MVSLQFFDIEALAVGEQRELPQAIVGDLGISDDAGLGRRAG